MIFAMVFPPEISTNVNMGLAQNGVADKRAILARVSRSARKQKP
jgi:hypothetical protein